MITGNEYRQDGFFSDDRHILDNKLMPSAESCYKDETKPEDILSLYREVLSDDGKAAFNSSKFNEGNFSNNTNHTGGKRNKTRKLKYRKNIRK